MKKLVIAITISLIVMGVFLCTNNVYAAEQAIDEKTQSKIIEIK